MNMDMQLLLQLYYNNIIQIVTVNKHTINLIIAINKA